VLWISLAILEIAFPILEHAYLAFAFGFAYRATFVLVLCFRHAARILVVGVLLELTLAFRIARTKRCEEQQNSNGTRHGRGDEYEARSIVAPWCVSAMRRKSLLEGAFFVCGFKKVLGGRGSWPSE
jgi:hypothetical protein